MGYTQHPPSLPLQAAERKELEQQIHLVKAPLAQKQEAEKLRVAVEERQENDGMQE